MFSELKKIYNIFQSNGIEDPLSETLSLCNIVTGGTLSNIDESSIIPQNIDLWQLAQKRKEGVPLEYIVGSAPFAGLRLHCSDNTLIPTEYTKLLVNVTLNFIEKRQRSGQHQTVIEVGTGCGNIAVLLGMYSDNVKIIASDISHDALKVAQKNIDKYNLNDVVSLVCGDLLSPFSSLEYKEKVDLVICNPPYIPTISLNKLSPEISGHQPRIALDGGPYGIDFFRRLTAEAIPILKPRGILIFEIGVGQEKLAVRMLSRNGGYEDIKCYKDNAGDIRIVSALRNDESCQAKSDI